MLPVRPAGIAALSIFFAFGTTMSGLAVISLAFPGDPLESMWRINPEGRAGLGSLGMSGVALMAVVSAACFLTAAGLWCGKEWGRRLAIAILVVNTIADVSNGVLAGDLRTLVGVPVAGTMLYYHFRSERGRAFFTVRNH